MQTVQESTAQSRWAYITTRASTPQQHACVLAASRAIGAEDAPALVAAYRRLIGDRSYEGLDQLRLSAGQIADLAIVVNGGLAGVNAHRLDGRTRPDLAGLGLIEALPGSLWKAHDWRATVTATVAGVAMIRWAQGTPVELNASEATPLALIERAMRNSADGGPTAWPGGDLELRIAQMWRLVEYVRIPARPGTHWSGQLGKAVYRLTTEGLDALERHRRGAGGGPRVAARTAGVMEKVIRYRGDLGVLDSTTATALQKCLDAGWLSEGGVIPGTDRRTLRTTKAGRDALEGWRIREQTRAASPKLPKRAVAELQAGQWVRLSNRKPCRGLGPGWVRVERVEHSARNTAHSLAHNYEVWVTTDAQPVPFLYGGRAHFRTVRFEVKPL